MGSQLMGRALMNWGGKLPPQSHIALIYMAKVALDADDPPVFFAGHDDILEGAFGCDKPTDVDRRRMRRYVEALVKAGAVEMVVRPTSRRRGITKATYVLNVDGPLRS